MSNLAQTASREMLVRTVAVVLIIAASLIIGCERPAPDASASVPAPQVLDSAGVRIVAAGFARTPLSPSEYLSIADTLLDGAQPLSEAVVGVVALQPLADSSLVLFTAGGPSLLRFPAPAGRTAPDTLRTAGSAPGAYSARASLLPYTPDTLLLWNAEAVRITRVTAAGLGDSVSLSYDPTRVATVSGAWRDGTVIGMAVALPGEQGAGVSRAPMAMLRFHPDGTLRDTLLQLRGPERAVQLGRPNTVDKQVPVRAVNVPFGRTTLWTVGTQSVLVLDTESCHVQRYDSTGVLRMRLDFHCAIEAVTMQDQDRFFAEVLASARSRSDSAMRQRYAAEASFPPSKSTASALLTDTWNRIWVRLPVQGPSDDWIWWVFDDDGMPLTRLGLGRQWRIAAVRERDLLLVESERDDAPPVVVRMALPAVLHHTP